MDRCRAHPLSPDSTRFGSPELAKAAGDLAGRPRRPRVLDPSARDGRGGDRGDPRRLLGGATGPDRSVRTGPIKTAESGAIYPAKLTSEQRDQLREIPPCLEPSRTRRQPPSFGLRPSRCFSHRFREEPTSLGGLPPPPVDTSSGPLFVVAGHRPRFFGFPRGPIAAGHLRPRSSRLLNARPATQPAAR